MTVHNYHIQLMYIILEAHTFVYIYHSYVWFTKMSNTYIAKIPVKGRLHSKFQHASLDMNVKTLCANPAMFQTLKTCVCILGNRTCSIPQV